MVKWATFIALLRIKHVNQTGFLLSVEMSLICLLHCFNARILRINCYRRPFSDGSTSDPTLKHKSKGKGKMPA